MVSCSNDGINTINLSGTWTVKLDTLNVGEKEKWHTKNLKGTEISLPGTLAENNLGKALDYTPQMNDTILFSLNRKRSYTGKAWYQKTIEIPENWEDKPSILNLERVIWRSKVYVNGILVDSHKSLSTAHRYKIEGLLKPGKNILTVLIDNAYIHKDISFEHERYPTPESQGFSHAYTNQTQGKWNGIIGNISLERLEDGAIEHVRVHPNLKERKLLVELQFYNNRSTDVSFNYTISKNKETIEKGQLEDVSIVENKSTFKIAIPESIEHWDEFSPNVYTFKIEPEGSAASYTVPLALREISIDGPDLNLNGERLFLRGNLDCAVYPIKGRVDMTEQGWESVLKVVKSYGFNHIRFHSWCPPKAAFSVADRLGLYLQVELPHWSLNVGENPETNMYLKNEMERILKDYGNHPSFMFLSMGNELEGNFDFLNELVEKAKTIDSSRIYTTSTFSFQKGIGATPQPSDDYFITQWTDKGWVRGQGFFNKFPPRFDADFRHQMSHIKKPLVSHEIGQYAVYPDLSEIDKYTGVAQPLNFKAIKNDLDKKGLLYLAPKFTKASGKLAALLYKEDIERALKTSGFDGFQMLQLQDYPGHGTALIGLLNVFWESKGIIDSTSFRQFNAPVVPLLRFEKATYASSEIFEATIEVANFKKILLGQSLSWSIQDSNTTLARGKITNVTIKKGILDTLGTIKANLNVEKAKQLTIHLGIDNTEYQNQWSIWVYPEIEIPNSEAIYTTSYTEAKQLLKEGKKVLLNPELKNINGHENRFGPIFWSQLMFPQPPNMGILCNPLHNAFDDFPTDSWSDWQWWDLTTNSKIIELNFPKANPLVRIIDDFTTNRNLGILFEAKVGKGKLLFSAIDLDSDLDKRIVAKQLKYSLMNYMDSKEFQPETEVNFKQLSNFIK